MRYWILAGAVLLALAGCAPEEETKTESDTTEDDSGSDTETISIVGTWTATIDGCTETDTYNTDGTFQIVSNQEISTGFYDFEDTVSVGQRHDLTITFVSDNFLPDCSGNTDDATGLSGTFELEFSNSGNTMSVYLDSSLCCVFQRQNP